MEQIVRPSGKLFRPVEFARNHTINLTGLTETTTYHY